MEILWFLIGALVGSFLTRRFFDNLITAGKEAIKKRVDDNVGW